MKKKWLYVALFIGFSWDVLFWKKAPGINFPIFVIVCLAAGYYLLKSEKIPPSRKNIWLLTIILYFSAMSFVRKDPLTAFLNYAISLLFLALLAAIYQSGLWIAYGFLDYIANAFLLIGNTIALPWKFMGAANNRTDDESKHKSALWPVLRGFLLALPILAIFAILLSSADQIFAQKLKDVFTLLNIENLGEYIARGLLILFAAYIFIGVYRYAAEHSQRMNLIGKNKPAITLFLGFTEGSIVLGSVIILFTTFVAIQFQYFFSGQANIAIDGFTYAEYARRGFGELVAVAIFSLLLIQSIKTILKTETTKQQTLFKGLVITLVILVLVMLVSAFQRLSLYESAYGFSNLRTYSHVFMVWLGLLLTGTALLEILQKGRFFTNLALLILVGFAITLNLMNVDAFIVRQNIRRSATGEDFDASYLASLSSGAVPELVREFLSPNQPDKVKEGIGAALACHKNELKNRKPVEEHWQSIHYSDWKARQSLETLDVKLGIYRVSEDKFDCEIISRNGDIVSCCNASYWD